MKIQIISNTNSHWYHYKTGSFSFLFAGIMWYKNSYYKESSACNKFIDILDLNINSTLSSNKLKQKFKELSGHFGVILTSDNLCFAFVDKVRSYPIFYTKKNHTFYLSNSARKLVHETNSYTKNTDSLISYQMSGYCLGDDTFYKSIKQLRAGEFLFLDSTLKSEKVQRYYRYIPTKIHDSTNHDFYELLHEATMKTFSQMIETLEGNPVWVPLSGGYDSRLILALLKELKYDNVNTYTYGLKNIWEVKRAKYIADIMDTKWHFIEMKPSYIRNYFYTEDRKDFFNFIGDYHTAPALPEYYGILELKKKKLIPENAIIINGQSGDYTSGGHIPKFLIKNESTLSAKLLIDTIISKHFSLWLNLNTPSNNSIITNKILSLLNISIDEEINSERFVELFELHECEERQSKFVINGQRAYEYFDYEWRLPLWSDQLMDFWVNTPWEIKFGQKLFIDYLNKKNFQGVFSNISLPPQYSYFPRWSLFCKPLFQFLSCFSNNSKQDYYRTFLKYFMTYSPFYPQKKYLDFLKDSSNHRNPISYAVKYYLEEEGFTFYS